MSDKKRESKFITKEILNQAIIESFKKLNPKYMIKNPVMFVVEVGFVISLLLTLLPDLFGDKGNNLRIYNLIVSIILFITVLFANFAEAVAEGRGKAQAENLKKTRKDTKAFLKKGNQIVEVISSTLKKGDVVVVKAGQVIPADGTVIE